MTLLLVAIAGGVGSVIRMWLGTFIERFNRLPMPVGTAFINITGAFALGLLTALIADAVGISDLKLVLGVGFLGGYTTFSTASVEVANLALGEGRRSVYFAVLQPAVMLVLAVGAGVLGLYLGSLDPGSLA